MKKNRRIVIAKWLSPPIGIPNRRVISFIRSTVFLSLPHPPLTCRRKNTFHSAERRKLKHYLFLSTTELLLQAACPDFVHELPHQAWVFILQEKEDDERRRLKPRQYAPDLQFCGPFAKKYSDAAELWPYNAKS